MKQRNYENNNLIIVLSIFIVLLEIIFLVQLISKKIFIYQKISGIVMKDNIFLLVMDINERKNLYKNKYIYYENKKIKYKMLKDNGPIITKDNKKYYEITIKTNKSIKQKSNSSITFAIKEKKINSIKIFKLIWDGDL